MLERLDHIGLIYIMLYGASAMLALVASVYMLLRRANAVAPEITSPVRLRRWTAALFASMALSHLWYLPTYYLDASDSNFLAFAIGGMLDFMTIIPLVIVVLMTMLQDRRRKLWPVFALMVPLVVGLAVCGINNSTAIFPYLYAYYLLMGLGWLIYMIYATRQYGRWLRDNYADLEHKEVWQSFIIVALTLVVLILYAFEQQLTLYMTQFNGIFMVCYLVWRVETLSDLSLAAQADETADEDGEPEDETQAQEQGQHANGFVFDRIEPLLQRLCIDTQLYVQPDLTITQLAHTLGTNRSYLSRYFSIQNTTYNAYINSLRIEHFCRIYRESVANRRVFTAKQLAFESGYRSYTTFSYAFKQQKGLTVSAWMREEGE